MAGLTPSELHEARVSIASGGARALLFINGGAAVAILGFLASTWNKIPAELVNEASAALWWLTLGVASSASNYSFRYWASMSKQSNWPFRYRVAQVLEWASIVFALSAFVFSIFSLVQGFEASAGATVT